MTKLKLQIDKEINLGNMPKKSKQRIIKKPVNSFQMCKGQLSKNRTNKTGKKIFKQRKNGSQRNPGLQNYSTFRSGQQVEGTRSQKSHLVLTRAEASTPRRQNNVRLALSAMNLCNIYA